MALNRRRLRDWIEKRGLTPPVAKRFALYHIGRFGPSLLCKLVADDVPAADVPAHMERQVVEEVKGHVDSWQGQQQYVVRAFASDGDEQQTGEFAFAETATMGTAEAVAGLSHRMPEQDPFTHNMPPGFETPHAMVTVQQMRHNEGLVRVIMDLAMHSRQRDAETIALLAGKVDKHEARQIQTYELLENMYTRQTERKLMEQKQDADEARKAEIMSKLTRLVLPAMAREAGLDKLLVAPSNGANGNGNGSGGGVVEEIKLLFLKLPAAMQDEIVRALGEDGDRLMTLFSAPPADEQPPQEEKTIIES